MFVRLWLMTADDDGISAGWTLTNKFESYFLIGSGLGPLLVCPSPTQHPPGLFFQGPDILNSHP